MLGKQVTVGQLIDDGSVMMKQNDRPVGKPQEKVLMNIAASFPSVKKPRFIIQEKSKQ